MLKLSTDKTGNTFDAVLTEIRKKSKNTVEQGRIFEELLKQFFEIDRHYTREFKKVSLWGSMPSNFRCVKDNPKGTDIGIDLVAETKDGKFYWIQSKFYDDKHDLGRNDILKFIDACNIYGKNNKTAGKIFVHTGDNVSVNAQKTLEREKIRLMQKPEFRASSVEWSLEKPVPKEIFGLYEYQKDAVDDVINGFETSDRGKLIMACGTGKTFVSLKIGEQITPKGGLVLFLVPSISLIQQSMREWSNNTTAKMRFIAVCSDKTVSKDEEGSIYELEANATTDPDMLREILNDRKNNETTVIFSTYHSIKTVSDATTNTKFDIVFCDEAHRTTGVDHQTGNKKDSPFLMVHNGKMIRSKYRLFMTATPRIYSGSGDEDTVKYSMGSLDNDEQDEESKKWFGSTFHYLSFHDAVHDKNIEALSDFKVKICIIPRKFAGQYISILDSDDDEIKRSIKLAAAWHAIIYPTDSKKPQLLQRVIAFSNTIKNSKIFTGEKDGKDAKIIRKKKTKTGDDDSSIETFTGRSFLNIIKDYNKKNNLSVRASIKHVDGDTNALTRRNHIAWLSESENDVNECRILSNARCLSEGVDVPALDGVLFLEPRSSIVDIVQSVGRVMRKVDGKDYGYVILPILVHEDDEEEDAVQKNDDFKIVYDVLNALRSHDADFDWDINIAALADKKTAKINRVEFEVMGVDPKKQKDTYEKYLWPVKSRLMKHVGTAKYFENYGLQVGITSNVIETKLNKVMQDDPQIAEAMEQFRGELESQINVKTDIDTTKRTVANHVILRRVFDAIFSNEFAPKNPIVKAFDGLVKRINLDGELLELGGYFDEVKRRMNVINKMDDENRRKARQELIKQIYEHFLSGVDKKSSEKHGIVYTPIEIIDFIIHSVSHLLDKNFKSSFADRSVKVLDPFTGTGAFISRLLESNLLKNNLREKYKNDTFANELMLLAYYVSTVNIETTYQSLKKGKHAQFKGINFTDTLSHTARYREFKRKKDERTKMQEKLGSFKDARMLLTKQKGSHVHVIIGNPPYSAGQKKDGDNQNIKYPEIDERIKDTYGQHVSGKSKAQLRDSYIRSIRWMSDRIQGSGIIGIISSGSFLKSPATVGLRIELEKEFDEIWCFDLRGYIPSFGGRAKDEGENVFGSGSKSPIAITFLVKDVKNTGKCKIYYKNIGDFLSKNQKLEIIKNSKSIIGIDDWEIIKPDKHKDWLKHRDEKFSEYTVMGSKESKLGLTENTIFKIYSVGVTTNRDAWVYNPSKIELEKNMKTHINYCKKYGPNKPKPLDLKQGKWDSTLTSKLKKKRQGLKFTRKNIRPASYRPFFKQWQYFDKTFHGGGHRHDQFFPNSDSENIGICVPPKFNGVFSSFITNVIPDIKLIYNMQYFPLYVYDGAVKKHNIHDSTLNEYRDHYKDTKIEKEDIFYYIYGLLHSPEYIKKFQNNLMRELPHIPMAANFEKFKDVGKKLAKLHLTFETCKKYELEPQFEIKKFSKLLFGQKPKIIGGKKKKIRDVTVIRADGKTLFKNIPETTYIVNGKTPVGWIIAKFKIETDEESGITKDQCVGIDIVSRIQRAIHIGVESERLIKSLPKEFEPKNWIPKKQNLDAHMDISSYDSTL